MEQATRNKLRNVVTQCRKLLEDSISQQLQGTFGIYAGKIDTVQVDNEDRMGHLSAEDKQYRRDLLDQCVVADRPSAGRCMCIRGHVFLPPG